MEDLKLLKYQIAFHESQHIFDQNSQNRGDLKYGLPLFKKLSLNYQKTIKTLILESILKECACLQVHQAYLIGILILLNNNYFKELNMHFLLIIELDA